MRIETITEDHFAPWLTLRQALWFHDGLDQLTEDSHRCLADPQQVGFLAIDDDEKAIGFIEARLYRNDDGTPRAHVEGWYVDPDSRQQGIGRALLGHVELWSVQRTITLLTSDTNPDYPLSPPSHESVGFRKLAELQIFVKSLKD